MPDMGADGGADEAAAEEIIKGTDPALYLALAVAVFFVIFIFLQLRKKRKNADVDDFFSNLDGDKFNLKLPAAVDEYYEVKAKCESGVGARTGHGGRTAQHAPSDASAGAYETLHRGHSHC